MRFSLEHLKRYLKTDKSVNELAEKLTMLGLEIEEIQDDPMRCTTNCTIETEIVDIEEELNWEE